MAPAWRIRGQRFRRCRRQFQMFRRYSINYRRRIFKVADHDDRALCVPASRAIEERGKVVSRRSIAAATLSAKAALLVINTDCAAVSCSACDKRSIAIQSGSFSHPRQPISPTDLRSNQSRQRRKHDVLPPRHMRCPVPQSYPPVGWSRCRKRAPRPPAPRRYDIFHGRRRVLQPPEPAN